MYDKNRIEDSLEFVRQMKEFYENEDALDEFDPLEENDTDELFVNLAYHMERENPHAQNMEQIPYSMGDPFASSDTKVMQEQKKLEEERRRLEQEEAERRQAEQEQRKRLEEERRRLEQEEARRRQAEQEQRKRLEEERRRLEQEEAKRRQAEQEQRKRLEQERQEIEAEKERHRLAEIAEKKRQEAERKKIEEERRRLAEEQKRQEELRRQMEEERKRVQEETKRREAELAEKRRLVEEQHRLEQEEARRRQTEQAEKKQLEEERLRLEQEEAKRRQAEQAEKKRLEEERLRLEQEEAKRRQAEQAEKKRLEEERLRLEQEEARRRQAEQAEKRRLEEERRLIEAEKERRRLAEIEENKRQEAERRKIEEERRRLAEEQKRQEQARRQIEAERQRLVEEQLQREIEEQRRRLAEQARKEAEEKARKEAEEKERRRKLVLEEEKRKQELQAREEQKRLEEEEKRKQEQIPDAADGTQQGIPDAVVKTPKDLEVERLRKRAEELKRQAEMATLEARMRQLQLESEGISTGENVMAQEIRSGQAAAQSTVPPAGVSGNQIPMPMLSIPGVQPGAMASSAGNGAPAQENKPKLSKEEIDSIFEKELKRAPNSDSSYQQRRMMLHKQAERLKKKRAETGEQAPLKVLQEKAVQVKQFTMGAAWKIREMILDKMTDPENAETRERAKKILSNVLVVVICIFVAFLTSTLITNFVAHPTKVEGESMETTLTDGDTVIIQKLSYYFGSPERYDVIVFPVYNSETNYIKRVIGLPGETVQIEEGKILINGKELEDDIYGKDEYIDDPGDAGEPITLASDEYFVLGDNRNMSTDSRSSYVGVIKKKNIVGKAWRRVLPFSKAGKIPH